MLSEYMLRSFNNIFLHFFLFINIILQSGGCAANNLQDPVPLKPYDRTDMPLLISHLKGNVYLTEDYNYFKTNSVFYAGSEGAWFINSTYQTKTAGRVYYKAESLTFEIFHSLILTGPDLHFTGGASLFSQKNLPVIMHPEGRKHYISRFDSMNAAMKELFPSWTPAAPVEPQTVTFKKNSESGLHVHSMADGRILLIDPDLQDFNGEILVYFPYEKILYGGDIISFPGSPVRYAENKGRSCAWCSVTRSLWPETVISGHGEAVVPFRSISEYCRSCLSPE